jgi:hypothetical protein
MDTTNPTVTIILKNGETITTYSTVSVYLTALPGQNAIQLQQSAGVVLHSVPGGFGDGTGEWRSGT